MFPAVKYSMTNSTEPMLLLHVCCAPCAAGCVERLLETGREVRLYYSNSNITTKEEFERRLDSVERLAGIFGLALEVDPYDHDGGARSPASNPSRSAGCAVRSASAGRSGGLPDAPPRSARISLRP